VDSQLLNIWENHTSKNLGISFQLSHNWEVKEKTSRFDDGPDLIAKNGLNSFSVIVPIPNDPSYMSELEVFSNSWSPNPIYPEIIQRQEILRDLISTSIE
jgi:hypothetical protein